MGQRLSELIPDKLLDLEIRKLLISAEEEIYNNSNNFQSDWSPSTLKKELELNDWGIHRWEIKEFKTLINSSPQFTELYKLGLKLENSVRHSSTHAAGVVISDESLDKMIPLYKGSRGETVTQYDMNAVEDLGFVKFDFLGLKTLTVIKKAKEFIVNQGIEIE